MTLYCLKSYLLKKKKSSFKVKTKVSFTERQSEKIFKTFDENHGIIPLKISKFFDFSKMTFSWSKKPLIRKKISTNDKTKVSFTEK